jgi:hypothetical protein
MWPWAEPAGAKPWVCIFRAHPRRRRGPGYPLQFLDPRPNLTHPYTYRRAGENPGGRIPKNACRVCLRYLRYAPAENSKYFSGLFPGLTVPIWAARSDGGDMGWVNGRGVCGISASIPCAGPKSPSMAILGLIEAGVLKPVISP